MGQLPQVKPERLKRALVKLGFQLREGAKHTAIHDGERTLAVIPRGSRPIRSGTLDLILRKLGVSAGELRRHL